MSNSKQNSFEKTNYYELALKNLNYLHRQNNIYFSSNYKFENFLNDIKNPEIFTSVIEKDPYFSVKKNDIWYHSRRDPVREAKRQLDLFIRERKSNCRHLIFLGSGAGYMIKEAFDDENIKSILLIEPDFEMLFYFLSQDFSDYIIQSKKLFLYAYNIDYDVNLEPILPFFQNKTIESILAVNHPPALRAFPEIYQTLQKSLYDLFQKRSVNQATLIKFQDLWNKNICLNIKDIISGNTLNELIKNKISKPIVIAGAGPSLSDSYEDLKAYRERYFLIAADTAFIPLAKNKIVPDIVISADPQAINTYYSLNSDVNKSVWVLDPVVCHSISHFLASKKCNMVWWDNPFYLDEIIRGITKDRGEIAHGGSVSTNAFDIAIKLKASKIILIGQDLSFSDKTAHVKGSVLESVLFLKTDRFVKIENHNRMQMKSLPPIPVKSIHKNTMSALYTNAKLKIFIDWFENQASILSKQDNVELYNATANGALLNGYIHKSLPEIFTEKDENIDYNIKDALIKNSEKHLSQNLSDAYQKIQYLYTDIMKLKKLYSENLNHSTDLIKTKDEKKKIRLISQLNENDKKIRKYKEANKILSLNAQNIILEITEGSGKQTAEELYRAMLKACGKTTYLFKKSISMLNHIPG